MERPIDLLCEEERLRRLSERMSLDKGDSAEPARQKRAQILVQEMTDLGPRLRSKSNEERRSQAIRALEAGLHARWKAVVHDLATPPVTATPLASTALMDALERVTVRSVVGLRGLTEVPQDVEDVVVAVLNLVTSEYVALSDDFVPPKTWEDARRVLLKPGHFVSSLRKFPSALEQGQVAASNVSFAQEMLANLSATSKDLAEVHEGAGQLHSWLAAAMKLTAASGFQSAPNGIATAASPARAVASVPAAYPRSAPSSPEQSSPTPTVGQSSKIPKATALRSTSPKAASRPVASKGAVNSYVSKPTPTAPLPVSSGTRSAGFNLSWSNLSGAPKPVLPRSGRLSGLSPQRRASPSPPPKVASKVVAKSQPSQLRSRPSMGTTSPQPMRPEVRTKSPSPKSPSPFTRSRSAGRDGKSQELVTTTGGNTLSFAAISTAAMPLSKDFVGMRHHLDKEKKEVRQIRSMESQVKWDMYREERCQTEEERREEARQIMEWRDREAKEMREYVEGKSREQRSLELMESKEYQEFKRAWKQAMRKQEIERIKVQLAENMDNAQWRVELQKAVEMDRQLALQENMEAQQELREIKEKERQREKVVQDEERVHGLALEYAHQAHQISTEKEALLRSLALLRERQKAPVAGTATRVGTTFWPIAR